MRRLLKRIFLILPLRWQAKIKRLLGKRLSMINRLTLLENSNNIKKYKKKDIDILFWRGPSDTTAFNIETLIATALRAAGHRPGFLICDGTFGACIRRSAGGRTVSEWEEACPGCYNEGVKILNHYGLPFIRTSDLISEDRMLELKNLSGDIHLDEIETYKTDFLEIGMFAKSSAIRYFRGRQPDEAEEITRRYLYATLLSAEAARNALAEYSPVKLFTQAHLEYAEWGPAFKTFLNSKIPVTIWASSISLEGHITLYNAKNEGFRQIYDISDEFWEIRKKKPLTEEEENALDRTLQKSWSPLWDNTDSASDEKRKTRKDDYKRESILNYIGISGEKPIWCLFTHLLWDAGFNPMHMVYNDIFEWTIETVKAMLEVDDVTWVVKLHPCESIEDQPGVLDLVRNKFPNDLDKLHFIPSNTHLRSCDLKGVISGGITMLGTVGMQLPSLGIPMICCDKTYYSGKGFTYDGITKDNYTSLIRNVSKIDRLTEKQIAYARRYSFAIYHQLEMKLDMMKDKTYNTPVDPDKLESLLPGNNRTIDLIINRILNGGEFIMDDPCGIHDF